MSTKPTSYIAPGGGHVPVVSYAGWRALVHELGQKDSLSPAQLVEACGFSFAMVVRSALGLSADGGVVTVFAADTFFGWVALAGSRHLLNSGTAISVITLPKHESSANGSTLFPSFLPALLNRGAQVREWAAGDLRAEEWATVERMHNVMCGISELGSNDERVIRFTSMMNESAVPVHTVGAPPGPSLESEVIAHPPLYASSTLSLGLPLSVLTTDSELIGRHYLCDLSLSREAYRRAGYSGPPLFAEQPVIKLSGG